MFAGIAEIDPTLETSDSFRSGNALHLQRGAKSSEWCSMQNRSARYVRKLLTTRQNTSGRPNVRVSRY